MTSSPSLIVRGLIGVLFGLAAFTWPGLTLTVLVILFGAYALLDGIANIIHGAQSGFTGGRDWMMVVQGIIGVLAGIVAFAWPAITLVVLVIMIGVWAVLTGVLEIAAAIRLRRVIKGEWLLATSGALSVVLGALLFAFPFTGALVLAWWVGAYAIFAGVVLIALGIRLRHDETVLHHRHA